MTTDSLDSHDIYTTVRTSWATRLTHVLRQGSCRISGFESDHTVGVWLTRE